MNLNNVWGEEGGGRDLLLVYHLPFIYFHNFSEQGEGVERVWRKRSSRQGRRGRKTPKRGLPFWTASNPENMVIPMFLFCFVFSNMKQWNSKREMFVLICFSLPLPPPAFSCLAGCPIVFWRKIQFSNFYIANCYIFKMEWVVRMIKNSWPPCTRPLKEVCFFEFLRR